jgi:23S rRNA (pseudouridine1915-N3)-methyltransferase
MSITILAVGKKHEDWVSPGVERYEKRLKQPFDTKWVLLPHSSFDGDRARQEESERIVKRIGQDDFVVLLDERGKNIDSPALSSILDQAHGNGKPVVCIIGGAYGVDETIHNRADMVWSLSKLVFPHQLVRLILIEQIYRAQEIARGGRYHHE